MEAFSDGVIAILITIMVLELHVPEGATLAALGGLTPVLLSYLLSFVFLGIYWNNHHHLLQVTKRVDGRVLWANMHLLFWLSLVPFATNWMGENNFAPWPVALYGVIMVMAGIGYYILSRTLLSLHEPDSPLAIALGRDVKGQASIVIYIVAIPLALVNPAIACGLYVLVAAMWLIPDKRLEKVVAR